MVQIFHKYCKIIHDFFKTECSSWNKNMLMIFCKVIKKNMQSLEIQTRVHVVSRKKYLLYYIFSPSTFNVRLGSAKIRAKYKKMLLCYTFCLKSGF